MSVSIRLLLLAVAVCCLSLSFTTASSVHPHPHAHASGRPFLNHRDRQIKYTEEALKDIVTNLPGLPYAPTFNQFSGYLTIDAASNRSIFYYYTESQSSTFYTDPLLWWSNGGPGCSGLIGFFTEHGPFRVGPNGTLSAFPQAWNTLANTLYVEAPVGVGFSFTGNASDYYADDARTARDNYAAIQAFYVKFPHLLQNDLYITSESYGGHYIPTLTEVIMQEATLTNFKGFLLGNPLTDPVENGIFGNAQTLCGHSLASKPTCDYMVAQCITNGQTQECDNAQTAVLNESGALDTLGLDYPNCAAQDEIRTLLSGLYQHRMSNPGFRREYRDMLQKHLIPAPYDACIWNELVAYLNTPAVQQAIHVSPEVTWPWATCTTNAQPLNYNRTDMANPMEPIYTNLLNNYPQLRMVIFSGDDDSVCATTGTQYWMYNLLGDSVVQPWSSWNYESEEYGTQIAGFITKFKGISLVTVHGAGHMVSGFQPEKGLAVLRNFLAGGFDANQ